MTNDTAQNGRNTTNIHAKTDEVESSDERLSNSTGPPSSADSCSLETSLWTCLQSLADAGDWKATTYVRDGRVRDTGPLSETARQRAEILINAVEATPNRCWRNAQLAALTRSDWCTYVEGYVQIEGISVPIEHAWVEINGRVAELTFDEAPNTPDNAAYIGVEYDEATIREMQDEFGQTCPIAELKERNRR